MMSDSQRVVVAVDAVGGDNGPKVILEGVEAALTHDHALEILLTGPLDATADFAAKHERCTAVETSEIIEMDEHPVNAVRSKKDSSIVVGCRLVREGRAQAFFSAGSTGACMTAATLVMGRAEGVMRPAIATVIPTQTKPVILLDAGANADCKPEHLLDFAFMGSAYARIVLGVAEPRIALLNIGEEPSKGSTLTVEAHRLMSSAVPGFIGNIEGRDFVSGSADVIVTDGFTGNVVLKLLEGASKSLLSQVKDAMTGDLISMAAASVLKPRLLELKRRLNPDTYGGAPLLGVKGECIIGHGSSGPLAVASAMRVAAQAVRGGLSEEVAHMLRRASDR